MTRPNATVARRKAAGLCVDCGDVPAHAGIQRCLDCAGIQRARVRAYTAARKAEGMARKWVTR